MTNFEWLRKNNLLHDFIKLCQEKDFKALTKKYEISEKYYDNIDEWLTDERIDVKEVILNAENLFFNIIFSGRKGDSAEFRAYISDYNIDEEVIKTRTIYKGKPQIETQTVKSLYIKFMEV